MNKWIVLLWVAACSGGPSPSMPDGGIVDGAVMPPDASPDAPIDAEPDAGPHGSKALIVVLHGYGSTGAPAASKFRMSYLDPADVAYIAPDGDYHEWASGPSSCCPGGHGGTVADVIAWTQARIAQGDIDPARVYVWGSSNGGMMAWRLVCSRPDLFPVVMIQSGSANGAGDPPCVLGPKVAILHVHGALDDADAGGVGYDEGGNLFGMPYSYPAATGSGGSLEQEGQRAGCGGVLAKVGQVPVTPNADKSALEWSGGCIGGRATHWLWDLGDHAISFPPSFPGAVLAWSDVQSADLELERAAGSEFMRSAPTAR